MNEQQNKVVDTPNPTREENTNWVFIPLLKKHILKRTDKYVLFDVDGVASGILNTTFLRKKESEQYVSFSVPADYEISCQVREKVEGIWTTTNKYIVSAKDIKPIVMKYNRLEENRNLPF